MNLDHVDKEFVDVDFSKRPEFVRGDNGPGDLSRFSDYESAFPTIPESDYKKYIEAEEANGGGVEWLISRIFGQLREGSCVGNATTQLGETLQALQFGKNNVVPLSAISMYQLIGRDPQSGAMVSDAFDAFQKRGIIPLDTPENRAKFGDVVMPHTGFYTKRPAGWEAVAANFRLTGAHVVRSTSAMCSAILNKRPCVVGRSGHSILYIKLAYRDGQLGIIYPNSWTLKWGFPMADFTGGFGFDTMGVVRSAAQWAFCGHAMTIPPWIKMGA